MSAFMTDQIIASFTLRTATSFEQRVRSAAAAGFRQIGLNLDQYRALKAAGLSTPDMIAILGHHGVRVAEIDVLVGFAASDPSGGGEPLLPFLTYATPEDEAVLFEMADAFGARHLQTIGTFDRPLEADAAVRFGVLCDRAADHNLLVTLEFMPGTSVPDAGVASRVVIEADRPNGGICVDSWHYFRGASDETLLRTMPAEKVFLLQISDGTVAPRNDNYVEDTLHNRMVPGEGEFDLPSMFSVLREIGVQAPVCLEVMSDELDADGPDAVAIRLAGAMDKYRITG